MLGENKMSNNLFCAIFFGFYLIFSVSADETKIEDTDQSKVSAIGEWTVLNPDSLQFTFSSDFDLEDLLNGDFGGLNSGSGGGEIIGNGGGLAEGTFEYAYQILASVLKDCIDSGYCVETSKDLELLTEIREITKKNIQNSQYLIFLSGEDYSNLFVDVSSGEVRTAVTGLKPQSPIFINTNHLYDEKTAISSWSVASAISLLVHEVGHHTGTTDHVYLDRLGQKVRRFFEIDTTSIEQHLSANEAKVFIWRSSEKNYKFDIFFFWNDMRFDLRNYRVESRLCPEGFDVADVDFSNLHWKRTNFNKENGRFTIPFLVWAKGQCVNPVTSQSVEFDYDLNFKVNTESTDGNQSFEVLLDVTN
jgi:predicted Zn-dependent protease with MMP-like domain